MPDEWPGWRICADVDGFAVRWSSRSSILDALAMCRSCSAKSACLDFVIDRKGILGPSLGGRYSWRIWGGALPDEIHQRLLSRWGAPPGVTVSPVGVVKRKQLRPAKPVSDERFLAAAAASATKRQNRLERERRAELHLEQARQHERSLASPEGPPAAHG